MYRFGPLAVKLAAVGVGLALVAPGWASDGAIDRARQKEELLARLTEKWQEGEAEYVLLTLSDSLAEAEYTPRLWNLQGMCLATLGRHREAVGAYERGLHQTLQLAELHLNLAVSLEAIGATGRAMTEFEEAVRIDSGSVEARLGYGRALLRFRRYERAHDQLRLARGLEPEDPRVILSQAELAEATGDIPTARQHWEELEAMDPTATSARRLAELHDDPGQRRRWYREAHRRDPDDPEVASALGTLLLEAGDAAAAIPLLEAAWDAAPEQSIRQHNLLLAYSAVQDWARLEAAVRTVPPTGAATWGVVCLARRQSGDSEGALRAVESAVAIAPEDLDLVNLQGVCLDDLGRTPEAIERWEWVLERDSGHPTARENLAARRR